MKVVYISGPMKGLPELNYPAFTRAEKSITNMGYSVENPANNPTPACGSWCGFMRLAIAQMMRCNILVRLPGWEKSKGASFENLIAETLGFEIYDLHDFLR